MTIFCISFIIRGENQKYNDMKTKKSVTLAVVLSSIFGCSQIEQPNFENIGLAKKIVERVGGEIFTGEVLATPTSGGESVVILKEKGRDTFSRAFVLQSKRSQSNSFKPFDGNLISIGSGLVIVRGEELHYIGVDSEESISILNILEEVSGNLKSYALGYGFSSNKGEWKIEQDMFLKYTANEILAISSLNPKVKLTSGKTMACECTSGGAGSTSCSIDEPLNGCSVTCGAGYYSCCMSSVTRCVCVQNGNEPPTIC